jgi:S-adenosylmethionine hydrolase
MQIITLTTDFGNIGYHVANLKASIYDAVNEVIIEDISHLIRNSDLNETAFILENSICSFPKYSLHICPIKGNNLSNFENFESWLLLEANHQYILCLNNGLASLINLNIQLLNVFKFQLGLSKILKEIFNNYPPTKQIEEYNYNRLTPLKPVFDGKQILISVVHIDSRGNAYTNLKKNNFEQIIQNSLFEIQIKIWDEFRLTQRKGVYRISKILRSKFEIKENEIYALFDENDNLIIGYGYDNAEKLLGIKLNDVIIINRDDNTYSENAF